MAAAEREFRAAVAVNPGLTLSVFALAEIEETRGNERAALDYYLQGAATGRGTAASYEALDRRFRKVHGDARSLDDAIDEVYRVKFPNPVKHEPYTRPAGRTDRLVLVEMFTGSACPPCVAADLALEGVLARYPADAIVALAYHANIPQPDPMVVSGGVARLGYYDVDGVPAFYVDGVVQDNGGGTIERAAESYRAYVSILDQALETPSAARVRLGATTDGKKVMVTARASSAQSPGARLHLVLVERELRFSGQNGVRFHPMVVRAVAGDKASGYALKPEGDTTVEHTFDLTAIAADVRTTLEDEIARRRKSAPGGAAARNWRVEGNALDAIDPRELTVVALFRRRTRQCSRPPRADVRTEPSSGASRD